MRGNGVTSCKLDRKRFMHERAFEMRDFNPCDQHHIHGALPPRRANQLSADEWDAKTEYETCLSHFPPHIMHVMKFSLLQPNSQCSPMMSVLKRNAVLMIMRVTQNQLTRTPANMLMRRLVKMAVTSSIQR
mmetsp:Transcript_39987/g.72064  ORF Transcript_39987/g.72064 Transcript_39987/m.72064 type:complete len:131 (-) Transcript_39987:44-436(-)